MRSAAESLEPNLSLERELLANSGLFDESVYLLQAGVQARLDPIGHYLRYGWRLGLEPNSWFPGNLLRPYFATVTPDEAPVISWLTLRSSGWTVPSSSKDLERSAEEIRHTGLLDEAFYRSRLGEKGTGLDPATHYLIIGERMGVPPSPAFDPEYYRARYPDVAQCGESLLLHYAHRGRLEGRVPAPAQVSRPGGVRFDPTKSSIILVVHETTRTGAPILGWNIATHLASAYNIFTVHLGDGELTANFEALSVEVHGPFVGARRNEVDIEYSLRPLLDARKYRYAIVNSSASRLLVEPCQRRFIPTLLLIHEFGSCVTPAHSLHSALDLATELVFPAKIVAEAAEEIHDNLRNRSIHILPQGIVTLPNTEIQKVLDDSASAVLKNLLHKHEVDETFIVLGAGALELRKGVEVFLATAASVLRRHPESKVHFLWVGAGYRPQEDFAYSVYLYEQLKRSGLTEHVTFLDAVPDLDPVYHMADAFYLSSRLDPLPNVTIDAAVRGIPVIAFKNASGMAEVMLENPDTSATVVEYLDSDAAADVIVRLAADKALRMRTGEGLQALARSRFDMKGYVAELDAMGKATRARMEQRSADAETLLRDSTFAQDMFLGPSGVIETQEDTILRYLTMRADCRGDADCSTYHRYRRPAPGFHPRLYATANAKRLAGGADPLADFVRRGKPPGPWQAPVLTPGGLADEPKSTAVFA